MGLHYQVRSCRFCRIHAAHSKDLCDDDDYSSVLVQAYYNRGATASGGVERPCYLRDRPLTSHLYQRVNPGLSSFEYIVHGINTENVPGP